MIQLEKKSVSDFSDVFLYENFLPSNVHKQIAQFLNGIQNSPRFNFEGRAINVGDKFTKLLGTNHYRPYIKLWDLSHQPSYWKQTKTTVNDWATNTYSLVIPPILRLLANRLLQIQPLTYKNYIPIRGIYNLLKPNIALDPHLDGEGFLADSENSILYSATYYVDVEKGEGGEFWDERGLLHKPKNNSVLINQGNVYIHGVRKSTETRLGVTLRFYAIDDLILPTISGNIDELLYKPTVAVQN